MDYFKRYEKLYGKSLIDLNLKDPVKVKAATIAKPKNQRWQRTFIEKILETHDPSFVEELKTRGFFIPSTYLAEDYNMNGPLERSLQLNAIKTAEILIEHCLG